MGRRLLTCLVPLRLFQILAAFIPGAMNGWLTYFLYDKKLGPSILILVLEILVAAVFTYSTLTLFVIHTRQHSRRTVFLICSLCLDVVFCFVDITIVSILSYTGLPSNCSGLTTSTWSTGDKPDAPSRGFSTVRFSNEQDGHKGQLDEYCSMERGFYFCTVFSILAFIFTIILTVMRIYQNNYTRNSEIQYLLDEREEILKLELKVQEQELQSHSRSPGLPPTPAAIIPKFSRDEEAAIEASILASLGRPVPSSSSSSGTPIASSSRFMGLGLDSIPEAGPHSRPSSRSSSPGGFSTVPSSPLGDVDPTRHLDAEEIDANLAMVSDGSRYGGAVAAAANHHQLPPYSPGNRPTMDGHSDESNDIRLSDYVKGETRAQHMKDEYQ